jgi:AraC-like DNA-binding protein
MPKPPRARSDPRFTRTEEGGEPCLARLAADLGFADQAHLTRVVRRELDETPSALRDRLAAA